MKVAYIDQHKERFGVQPICEALKDTDAEIAPSTYYATASRPASARSIRDQELTEEISVIHADNYGVYGARKIHAALLRHGRTVARCTVERLMRQAGLRGVIRARSPRTTRPAPETARPADLVKRQFTAGGPNVLWVADITCIRTSSGWVYAAFVIDVFSRMVVGWQVATSLYTDLALDALDALEMALWRRRHAGDDLSGLVHHSDRGVQYEVCVVADGPAASGALLLPVGGLVPLLRDDRLDATSAQVGAVAAGGVGLVGGDRVRPGAGAADPPTDPDLLQHGDELRAAGCLSRGQEERQRPWGLMLRWG